MAIGIDFRGPYLKAERAEHHIRQLEVVFDDYVRKNENALRPNHNFSVRNAPIGNYFPSHTPTILGDAIHNLRASLDHAYCVLVKHHKGVITRDVQFPISKTEDWKKLERTVQRHTDSGFGPSPRIIREIFDHVQPYPGGKGADLVSLHLLDIADKHTILLPTAQLTNIQNLVCTNGSRISGITFITDGGPAVAFGPGAGFVPTYNNKVSVDICFGGGQPFEWEPVLPIIKALAQRVHETLDQLKARVEKAV